MTHKHYHDLLDEIAASAQPAQFRIKQTVQQRLKPRHTAYRGITLRWRPVATMLILLVFGGIVYSMYYQQQTDAGRDYVYDMNLGQDLNIQDSIGGMDVTLTWAYADANRMILEYQFESSSDRPVSIMGGPSNTNLTTLDGIQLPTKGGSSYTDDNGIGYGTIAFDTRVLSSIQDSLTLRLETSVIDLPGNQSPGDLSYQFTIPYYQGSGTDVDASQTRNGLTVDLESVLVTPSMILTTVCYDLPTMETAWLPDARIIIDDESYDITSINEDTVDSGSSDRQCVDLQFGAPVSNDVTEFDLVVTALQTGPDFSDRQAVIDAFAEYGVEISLAPGGSGSGGAGGGGGGGTGGRVSSLSMNVIANPDNVDIAALLEDDIMDRFRDREPGAWQFTKVRRKAP